MEGNTGNSNQLLDQDIIYLTEKRISIDDVYKNVVLPSTGATSLFIGTTRDNFKGKQVVRLQYEAYTPMAEKEIKKICTTVRQRLQVGNICVVHRTGDVPIGEASVVIAVSSVHRKEALEAVQFMIDTLKETVPIWKKEIYEEGDAEWKSNKISALDSKLM